MLNGSGERAFDVAEELGFQEIFGEGVTVHSDQGLLSAGARQMNCLRDHLFASSSFSGDEDRRAPAADQANDLNGSHDGFARSNNVFAPGFDARIRGALAATELRGCVYDCRRIRTCGDYIVGPQADVAHGIGDGRAFVAYEDGSAAAGLH